MAWGKTVMTVAAIVRRDGEVLVVRERTSNGEQWALPGGVVEPDELLHEAVARELLEETGLTVTELGPLLVMSQHVVPPSFGFEVGVLTAFGFEVRSWHGEVQAGEDDEDHRDEPYGWPRARRHSSAVNRPASAISTRSVERSRRSAQVTAPPSRYTHPPTSPRMVTRPVERSAASSLSSASTCSWTLGTRSARTQAGPVASFGVTRSNASTGERR